MTDREADIAGDRRIQYRVGINLGEIIVEGEDIFGDGVNVASRLEALAEPGGIRISRAVFNNVKGKLDLGFSDLGPQFHQMFQRFGVRIRDRREHQMSMQIG